MGVVIYESLLLYAMKVPYSKLCMPGSAVLIFIFDYTGGAKPWTRLLLYGPPGTGKTKLARAVASELQCSFYFVSASNLLSSWVGESEK